MNQEVGVPSVKETEVLAKAKRRGFTAEYKQRILNEMDAASLTFPGNELRVRPATPDESP